MATRRHTSKTQPVVNGNLDSRTIMKSTPSLSDAPLLPTFIEGALLSVYPLILLLGSLYATFHPALRTANYLPDAQAYDPAAAPSYFAKKGNVFNVYFVKIGWAWTTLAFGALTFSLTTQSSSSLLATSSSPSALQRRRLQSALRFTLVTAAWIAVTQWFGGAAIVDRIFRWTGGQCEAVLGDDPADLAAQSDMSELREAFTHAACKSLGGTWRGGHDISGHVFLLILGSATLVLEALPALLRAYGIRDTRRVRARDGSIADAGTVTVAGDGNVGREVERGEVRGVGLGVKFAMGVAGLSWWMLLMTAVYFHTWFEKLTGLLVALTTVFVVYFLPREIPSLSGVLGLPGI